MLVNLLHYFNVSTVQPPWKHHRKFSSMVTWCW